MTMIEVMVVVAIIGLMMAAVGHQVWKQWKEAQVEATKREIVTTKTAIARYLMRSDGRCPESLEDLVVDEILDDEPLDAWGGPLLFSCPAEHGRGVADIWSTGPDGIDATEDDICSWKIRRRRRSRRRPPS